MGTWQLEKTVLACFKAAHFPALHKFCPASGHPHLPDPRYSSDLTSSRDPSSLCKFWKVFANPWGPSQLDQLSATHHCIPAPCYQLGQLLWLSKWNVLLSAASHKLAPHFIGPFPIKRVVKHFAICLVLPPSLKFHPNSHVLQLKPVSFCPLVPPSKLPWFIKGHPAFTVPRLMDIQREGQGIHYLVDWEGYWLEERSFILDLDLTRPF